MNSNITWHHAMVSRQDRERLAGHKSFVLWFTGLSGSGKSTLAHRVEELLFQQAYKAYVLDGDNVRHGLCQDLGFSAEDRSENIRRIGETCKLFVDAGSITLAAFISPFRKDRDLVRSLLPEGDFIEVFCDASLGVCEARDSKGLYQKARVGLIADFTGISSPYEPPEHPEITANTGTDSLDDCAWQILNHLELAGKIKPRHTEPTPRLVRK